MGKPAKKIEPEFQGHRADLAEMARRGDLAGLISDYVKHGFMTEAGEKELFLEMALSSFIEKGGTAELIDKIFQHVIKFDTLYLLRAETMVRQSHVKDDQHFHFSNLPQSTVEEDLPRIVEIEHHVAWLCKTYATIRHLLALSGADLGKNMNMPQSASAGRIIPLNPSTMEAASGE